MVEVVVEVEVGTGIGIGVRIRIGVMVGVVVGVEVEVMVWVGIMVVVWVEVGVGESMKHAPFFREERDSSNISIEAANAKVLPLQERIAELEQTERIFIEFKKEVTEEFNRLQASRKRLRDALEWYAEGFKIMDHIDGTYTIHETWYVKAREALADDMREMGEDAKRS